MAAERYEDRHRALREAEVATRVPQPALSREHGRALLALQRFHLRTAPPIADLVAAVREHDHCAEMGACAICDALAALDEASARG